MNPHEISLLENSSIYIVQIFILKKMQLLKEKILPYHIKYVIVIVIWCNNKDNFLAGITMNKYHERLMNQ